MSNVLFPLGHFEQQPSLQSLLRQNALCNLEEFQPRILNKNIICRGLCKVFSPTFMRESANSSSRLRSIRIFSYVGYDHSFPNQPLALVMHRTHVLRLLQPHFSSHFLLPKDPLSLNPAKKDWVWLPQQQTQVPQATANLPFPRKVAFTKR